MSHHASNLLANPNIVIICNHNLIRLLIFGADFLPCCFFCRRQCHWRVYKSLPVKQSTCDGSRVQLATCKEKTQTSLLTVTDMVIHDVTWWATPKIIIVVVHSQRPRKYITVTCTCPIMIYTWTLRPIWPWGKHLGQVSHWVVLSHWPVLDCNGTVSRTPSPHFDDISIPMMGNIAYILSLGLGCTCTWKM